MRIHDDKAAELLVPVVCSPYLRLCQEESLSGRGGEKMRQRWSYSKSPLRTSHGFRLSLWRCFHSMYASRVIRPPGPS